MILACHPCVKIGEKRSFPPFPDGDIVKIAARGRCYFVAASTKYLGFRTQKGGQAAARPPVSRGPSRSGSPYEALSSDERDHVIGRVALAVRIERSNRVIRTSRGERRDRDQGEPAVHLRAFSRRVSSRFHHTRQAYLLPNGCDLRLVYRRRGVPVVCCCGSNRDAPHGVSQTACDSSARLQHLCETDSS